MIKYRIEIISSGAVEVTKVLAGDREVVLRDNVGETERFDPELWIPLEATWIGEPGGAVEVKVITVDVEGRESILHDRIRSVIPETGILHLTAGMHGSGGGSKK